MPWPRRAAAAAVSTGAVPPVSMAALFCGSGGGDPPPPPPPPHAASASAETVASIACFMGVPPCLPRPRPARSALSASSSLRSSRFSASSLSSRSIRRSIGSARESAAAASESAASTRPGARGCVAMVIQQRSPCIRRSNGSTRPAFRSRQARFPGPTHPALPAEGRSIGLSHRACPRSAKRRRHLPTVFASAPTRSTMAVFWSPSAAAKTIRARCARPFTTGAAVFAILVDAEAWIGLLVPSVNLPIGAKT